MNGRRRNEAQFNELMRSTGPDLLAYFERRVGFDGADLLTELMTIAWRKYAQIPHEPTAARMWLFGVARNVTRNNQRGTIRRARAGDALHQLTEQTAQHPDPADAITVRDLIERLEPDLAEVVTLAHWEGFSHAEIGQLLGVPASTIRGRYQRARNALRAALELSEKQSDTEGAIPASIRAPRTRRA